jgi:glycosyltransferase involved in cell wall biosynthesis
VVPVKIAILGTRGVPPSYGGFETMAAELGTRLIARGHEVSVYCREAGPATWNGIRRIVVPALHGHKYLETVSHSFLSALDVLRRDFDAVLVCNAANAFVLPILRAARIPVAINVDGIERKRRKWNILGRAVYAIGEAFSASFASAVIADAEVIDRYYREHYAIEPAMIPYGADFPIEDDSDVLQRLGLEPRRYLLYVSRFEPENNPLEVVEAFEKQLAVGGCRLAGERADASSTANCQPPTANCPLVMLGKGLYAPDLVAALHRHASDHVLFPGALYGRDYRTLQRHALLYIQATEVGGTHPAMIEAMASGGAVLAHDTPENREVGGDAVGYFQLRATETLSGTISELLANSLKREEFRARARKRAEERYSWATVTESYERVFLEVAGY